MVILWSNYYIYRHHIWNQGTIEKVTSNDISFIDLEVRSRSHPQGHRSQTWRCLCFLNANCSFICFQYDLLPDTAFQWVIAHTSGTVRSYQYSIGSTSRKEADDYKDMSWSVDTRPWQVIVTIFIIIIVFNNHLMAST